MSDAPEELTDSMAARAQRALDFYPSESIPMSDIRGLRALVLRHECEINPPSDSVADHDIRAVTLTDWFPGVPGQKPDHGVEDVEKPKRSFFKKKKKDSQAEAPPVEAVEEADSTPDTAETVEAPQTT
jgi:hypothetical protein